MTPAAVSDATHICPHASVDGAGSTPICPAEALRQQNAYLLQCVRDLEQANHRLIAQSATPQPLPPPVARLLARLEQQQAHANQQLDTLVNRSRI